MSRSVYLPPPPDAYGALCKRESLAPSIPANLVLELAVPVGAVFVGEAKFSEDAAVLICGSFSGSIECGALYVAAGGRVKGRVRAIDLYAEGTVDGRVDVRRLLHAGAHAQIQGIRSMGLVRVISPRALISAQIQS